MGEFAAIGSSILLFFLVFGMSATVDILHMRKQLRNRNALLTGVSLQFVILPFLGFCVVRLMGMSAPMGITLLVITSSPGGSYSNWWCSMFNADLALSVTMTAISTLLSVVMLPVNLIIYASTSYSSAVVKSLDWAALFHSLVTVIGAITAGLICSATVSSRKFNLFANKLGNVAGISLVTYSVVISSGGQNGAIWDEDWQFYIGIALPCILGLVIASLMASYFQLVKPERVAVAVECCYQNTGIATSVAITMFEGDDLATAVSVSLFYGICEAVILAVYCLVMWKAGWTKAPHDENICVVIATSYEVQEATLEDPEAIEIVLGLYGKDGPNDLIFTTTSEGYQIDEESLHALDGQEGFHIDEEPLHIWEEQGTKLEDATADESMFSELDQEQESDHSDSETAQDASAVRRKSYGRYSSLGADAPSPLTEKNVVESSPPIPAAPLDGANNETVSSRGIPLRLAVVSLRSRGTSKYTKAVSDVDVAIEEDEDEQNFEFPELSPATAPSRKPTSGGHVPIPSTGKTID